MSGRSNREGKSKGMRNGLLDKESALREKEYKGKKRSNSKKTFVSCNGVVKSRIC